ncbi:hypothetical protein CEXT_412681 [Caerostris extrusa]|uniref:Uncharacterized protein n=1 Tax=Caerostris extrusa TaxID=172846 RepID=A0AAV4N6P8_CAEEX|nr:hypothetical protein CEXT_412681 [Caerostris extrusa]
MMANYHKRSNSQTPNALPSFQHPISSYIFRIKRESERIPHTPPPKKKKKTPEQIFLRLNFVLKIIIASSGRCSFLEQSHDSCPFSNPLATPPLRRTCDLLSHNVN